MTEHTQQSKFFGRRQGRPLRRRKAELMESNLPALTLALPAENSPLIAASQFPFAPQALWMEIGFGGGEHLVAQAEQNPAIAFIGCEPFRNGVASLLDHIDRRAVKNIRIYPNDARHVLDALPDASLDRCFVLFSDPWPKARHAERRFIGTENLPRLARVLKAGAELRLATDDAQLATWMTEHCDADKNFARLFHGTTPPADWVATRYEQKAIKAGRQPVYMGYQRR